MHDNQAGCIRFSYFSGDGDRLPQITAACSAPSARLALRPRASDAAGYAQLRRDCDLRIREEGPTADEMGAFGYLLNTHKWKNIGIRLREFMPVGVRADPASDHLSDGESTMKGDFSNGPFDAEPTTTAACCTSRAACCSTPTGTRQQIDAFLARDVAARTSSAHGVMAVPVERVRELHGDCRRR